ncbi:MAG: DEAD/DEAH box helicase [Alphaproteobacteria bacterium]
MELRLARVAGRLRLSSRCDCPSGGGCEHAAGALHALLRQPAGALPASRGVPPAESAQGLPRAVAAWLGALDAASPGQRAATRQRVLYVLSVRRAGAQDALMVQPVSVRVRADGGVDAARAVPCQPAQAVLPQPPRFMSEADVAILSAIHREALRARFHASHGTVVAGPGSGRLLEDMLATGGCRWEEPGGPALAAGPRRAVRAAWRARAGGVGDDAGDEEGSELRLGFEGEGVDRVVPVSPPFYVDLAAGLVGRIEGEGMPEAILAALVAAPGVPPEAAPLLAAELRRRFPDRPELLPPTDAGLRRVGGRPRIRLFLSSATLRRHLAPAERLDAQARVVLGALSFAYEGEVVPDGGGAGVLAINRDGATILVERDVEAEATARRELARLGMSPAAGWADQYRLSEAQRGCWIAGAGVDGALAEEFLGRAMARWSELGWDVSFAADWPWRLLELEGELDLELREGSGLDWLDLELGAVVDGRRVNLLPALLGLLGEFNDAVARLGSAEAMRLFAAREGVAAVRLDDGRRAGIAHARLVPFLAALSELLGSDPRLEAGGRARLSRARGAALDAIERAARARWVGGDRLREAARRLADPSSLPEARIPEGFAGELRAYQRQGLAWLQCLREAGFNGILADDMGLGKTVQTLAHLVAEKESGRADRPSLVVAPTSLLPNWSLEAARFAPGLRVALWHGGARSERDIDGAELVVTSYALLARDRAVLAQRAFHVVVLDEAQAIKNPLAHATQAAHALQARHRLCLTGTPLENNLGELWSIMHFLNPGLLGDRRRFARDFRGPIEKLADARRRDALARRVRPFLLRRTKDAVERDLPPRTEILEMLELGQAQRDIYESVRLAAYGRVREEIAARGLARSHVVILDALMKLRQACCDPRLLRLASGARDAGSAKLERLMEMLPSLLAEGRRAIVFSQFTSMLALVGEALDAAGIAHVVLTGATTDRATPVRRFQDGEVPVFLVSLKAGGTGLNLTAADTVILYDPWWNPAAEAQAIDRAHRIGQRRAVFAYRLIARGTVEEKILELQGRKRALAQALLEGEALSGEPMDEADVEALFAPPS